MGFRFRRSFKLAPGIRINLTTRGVSTTIGPRGANVNIGPRGTYANVGIPGTGLSARERLDAPAHHGAEAEEVQQPAAAPTSGAAVWFWIIVMVVIAIAWMVL
jgi:hypothetical protein